MSVKKSQFMSIIILGVFVVLLIGTLVAQVWARPIDRDEGFWMYTGWRVSEGDVMYRDFALPHLPLANLYYAAITKLSHPSLYIPRLVNVVLILISAGAVYVALRKRGMPAAAMTWLFIYLGSFFTLTWLIPVKAYAPCVFFITLSLAVWMVPVESLRKRWFKAVLAGVFLGLAVSARLTAVVFLPALIVAALAEDEDDIIDRISSGLAAFIGFLFCAPLILYFTYQVGTDAFIFNVWGIHKLVLEQVGIVGRFASLWELMKHVDFVIIFLLSIVFVIMGDWRKMLYPLIGGALAIAINFVPGTTQPQYFTIAVPVLALVASFGVIEMYRRWRFLGPLILMAYMVIGMARPIGKIVYDRAHLELTGPINVYKGAELLRKNSNANDIIFAPWPGYAALAERQVLPGWELGYFTDRIGVKVDAQTREKYNLVTYPETAYWLQRGAAEIVIYGIDTPDELIPTLENNFDIIDESAGVQILRFSESTLPEGEGRATVDL